MAGLPQNILDAIENLIEEKFNDLLRDHKLNAEVTSTDLTTFENDQMLDFDGNEKIDQGFFRKFLRWLSNYINTLLADFQQIAFDQVKYVTPVDYAVPPDCGKIIAPFANLILTGAGVKPTVPDPATTTADDAGFDQTTHLMEGGFAHNITDNLWYYRANDTIYNLTDEIALGMISTLEINSMYNLDDLAAKVAVIGATETTLIITTSQSISDNLTIPSTLSVVVKSPGLITIATGKTLTINGSFEAGLYQVFDCEGTGSVAFGTPLEIYPNWWGASPSASAAVNDTAFTKSIAALSTMQTWRLPSGNYSTSQVITFANKARVKINFDGRIDTSTNDGILFDTISISEISGIDILYPVSDWSATYYGVKFRNCGPNTIQISSISRFYYGIYWQADGDGAHYNNIYFTQIYDARYGIYIENINAGSGNENTIFGGKFQLTNAHYIDPTYFGEDGSWAVYFVVTDTYGYNNWRFYDLSVEDLHNGFRIIQSNHILLIQPRFEGTSINVGEYWIDTYYYVGAVLTVGAVSHLVWIPGIAIAGFDATKLRLGMSRDLLILGAGKAASSYQTIITNNAYGGISWITEKNMVQSHAGLSASQIIGSMYLDDYFGNRLTYNKSYQDAAIPASGTYRENAVVWNTDTGTGKASYWLCTADGTMNADPGGMTATTSAGTKTVTIVAGDITDLLPGQYVDIVGDGSAWIQIVSIDYVNSTFVASANIPNTVTAAVLTFHDATWTVGPAAGGWTALSNEATPSVLNMEKVVIAGTTTITNFINGIFGQELKIYSSVTVIITDGTNIFLNGSANWTMTATDMLHLIQRTDGKWYEMGRGDNGA